MPEMRRRTLQSEPGCWSDVDWERVLRNWGGLAWMLRNSASSVCVHFRSPLAASRGQMPDEHDDRPEFVVRQDTLGTRHSGGLDSIVENGLQLTIGIALDLG